MWTDVSSTRKRIEPWRLAYPSGVDLYIEDCVIRSHLTVSNPEMDPFIHWTAPEDDYLEWYVCMLIQHSDFRWDVSTGYGAPGAPVSDPDKYLEDGVNKFLGYDLRQARYSTIS
jgi:hypothetical protein